MHENKSPAQQLEMFLNYVDLCVREYNYARDQVKAEENSLQDYLHELEFAPDKAARNRVATKLQQSRKLRRKNKDIVLRNERMVKFFEEQNNRATLNRMRQLLGQQRKSRSTSGTMASRMEASRSNCRSAGSWYRSTAQPASRSPSSYSEKVGAVTRACRGCSVRHSRKIRSAAPLPQMTCSAVTPSRSAIAARSSRHRGSG